MDYSSATEAEVYGADVFGPILGEFSLRLWLFLSSLTAPETSCVLFCTRGGLRLKLAYERFLARTGLQSPVPVDHLMVSRLIAARLALESGSKAAFEEISFEFRAASLEDAIFAVASTKFPLSSHWSLPYSERDFELFTKSEGEDAEAFRSAVRTQNELFRAHFGLKSQGRRQVVICDSGLSGSTLRLLQAGLPDREFSCALLARRDYKGLSTAHFPRIVGLGVERDYYRPDNSRTTVLRYWQLVEWLLEPKVPSARTFTKVASRENPVSNLEVEGWEGRVSSEGGMFGGALAYIDTLEPSTFFVRLVKDRDRAWKRLASDVLRPSRKQISVLAIDDRSSDFGRGDTPKPSNAVREKSVREKLRRVQASHWREGEVVRVFGPFRALLQPMLQAAHVAKWVLGTVRAVKAGKRG